ncbi:MAG: pyridoxal-phosphate dependent enzyme [Bacteroidota bacterium]
MCLPPLPALPVQEIPHPAFTERGLRLSVLRTDLTHPYISGNKYFKLMGNLRQAKAEGHCTLITFGGAYSNHLTAFAAAGALCGFKTIALVRGEETLPLNPVLSFAKKQGTEVHYISRTEYRNKHLPEFAEELAARFGRHFLIPEGGSNIYALEGCRQIIQPGHLFNYNHIALACGTGGTMAGIISGVQGRVPVTGFPVLKQGEFIGGEIRSLLSAAGEPDPGNWDLQTGYHFGGYAKIPTLLEVFMTEFTKNYNIPLEGVYTGKLMAGLVDLANNNGFQHGTSVLAIHTGGVFSF